MAALGTSTVQPNAYVRYSVGMGTGDEDLGGVFDDEFIYRVCTE